MLSQVAETAASRFLFSQGARAASKLPLMVTVAQLNTYLRLQKKLPRHPLEIPELPFDRLLLHSSRHYLQTRKLAASLGIRLIPKPVPLNRKLVEFDPKSRQVAFSPIDRRQGITTDLWPDLRKYSGSAFHDLNHAIFFGLLRPHARTWCDPDRALEYFALVESLVILRDAQMSLELGSALVPLQLLGVVYSKPRDRHCEKGAADPAWFRSQLLVNYCLLLGMKSAKARKFVSGPELPSLNDQFVLITHRRWVSRFRRSFKDGSKGSGIPPVPTAQERRTFNLQTLDPERLARSREEIARLHAWFQGLF